MALIEIDHLVRSTGVTIIVIFLHSYLIAEKGTGYQLAKETDDEEGNLNIDSDIENPQGGLGTERLSTLTDVNTTEQRINEIQDDDEDGEI